MKKYIKLLEAADAITTSERMELFNKGKRTEDLTSLSLTKLITYYKICLDKKFKSAERQIAAELLKQDAGKYVKPDPVLIDSTQFTPYEAQYIKKYAHNPTEIVETALKHPFPHLTSSDTLTIYLIWAIALKEDIVAQAIQKQMKRFHTYYDSMPAILNEILSRHNITKVLADIINGMPKEIL